MKIIRILRRARNSVISVVFVYIYDEDGITVYFFFGITNPSLANFENVSLIPIISTPG